MLRWIIIVFLSIPLSGDAQNWHSVGSFNTYPTYMFTDSVNSLLYAGGYFTQINSEIRWGVASWNNSNWDSLGLGIDNDSISTPGMTKGFLRDGNYVYAVGAFKRAGTINTNCIARWNGTTWDSVPGCRIPNYQSVNDIIKFNGEIYICGSFDSIGNLPAHGLAKWNGVTWQTVGNNYDFATSGFLNRIRFYHGNLYASGNFQDNNGNTCRLAKWDGMNWYFMTSAVQGTIAAIQDMEVYQDKLYVGGLFFQSAGNVANSLQSWNDTTWCAVGGSVQIFANQNPTVRDLCVHDNLLYCGGNFEKIGGIMADAIAFWNGTDWCSLGSDFDNTITQINFYQDTLYVIGGFLNIDQTPATYIAKWIGGNYVDTCGNMTAISESDSKRIDFVLFPNPVINMGTFEVSNGNESFTLVICDQFGRVVLQKMSDGIRLDFLTEGIASGLYYYTIVQDGEVRKSGKMIIE